MEFITNNLGLIGGLTGSSVALFILKRIPNEEICKYIEGLFFGIGKTCTLGLSSWSWSKGLWNKTIEPYFIDLLENVVGGFVSGAVKGLRSDK